MKNEIKTATAMALAMHNAMVAGPAPKRQPKKLTFKHSPEAVTAAQAKRDRKNAKRAANHAK